jgi:arabinogalactan oligomer/maltooligosaccharide transport system substrate-binding protein
LRLALAVVVFAAGCRDASERRAHLTIGTFWSGAGAQALQSEVVRIAHDLGPVNIEVRNVSAAALLDDLNQSQPREGRQPLDLAIVPHDWIGQLVQRDIIGELPAERVLLLRQRLIGQALQAVSEGQRVFGFPVSAQVLALVYDPALFEYPPRAIEEIVATRFPAGVLPFALDIGDPSSLAPLVGSMQGTLADPDGGLIWRSAAVAKVLRRLAPAWGTSAGWRACRGSDLESLQVQLFAEGKLASFIAGPWLLQALEESGRPFAVMPIPPLAPGMAPARALVGYQCVVVSRESRWGDLALEVGARLVHEGADERINRATRRLPVLMRAYELKPGFISAGNFGFLRALEQGMFVPATESWSEGFAQARRQLKLLASRAQPPAPGDIAVLLAGSRP